MTDDNFIDLKYLSDKLSTLLSEPQLESDAWKTEVNCVLSDISDIWEEIK